MGLSTTDHITGTNTHRRIDTHKLGGPCLLFGVDFTDHGSKVCVCVCNISLNLLFIFFLLNLSHIGRRQPAVTNNALGLCF